MKIIQIYFPLIMVFILLGIMFLTLFGFNLYQKHKKKRSPFTGNFLRSPGETLNEKLIEINEELMICLTSIFVLPFAIYSMFLSDLYFRSAPLNFSSALLSIVICALFLVYFLLKSVKLFKLRRLARLGYEGEINVGQELNQMMRQGYHVYHDFIADKFNIDHIVIGPAGVFAVETKARAKPTSDNRAADAKVTYDGKSIQFPRWKETKPLEQAKNQAVWLEKWLSSATGEQVP